MGRLFLVVIAATIAIAACRPSAPPVTAAHAQWAQTRWPAITIGELERGRSLFMAKCSACHVPPAPSDRTPADWPAQVAEMSERAHLAPEERQLIERYVVTVAALK